jgi:rubredoxin
MKPRHRNSDQPPEEGDELLEAIKPLAAEIGKLQSQLKAAGLFAHDRELLECPQCGVEEDVTAAGVLITCRPESPGVDTGHRFQSINGREEWWCCPECGTEFRGEGISE